MWDGRRNPDAPPSLIASRSSKDHAAKRVPWTHAFSTASVREYQPAIIRRASQLAEELEKRALAREDVNLVTYMTYFAYVILEVADSLITNNYFYSFDFMGDLA